MDDIGTRNKSSTLQAQRLVRSAVRLCEPYVGPDGAVVAGLLRDGRVTAGMYGASTLDGNALGSLVCSMIVAVNRCLSQGEFKFRYKVVMVECKEEQ